LLQNVAENKAGRQADDGERVVDATVAATERVSDIPVSCRAGRLGHGNVHFEVERRRRLPGRGAVGGVVWRYVISDVTALDRHTHIHTHPCA